MRWMMLTQAVPAVFVGVLAGCATPSGGLTGIQDAPARVTAGPTVGSPGSTYTGPKKRIAVAKFDANGAFVAQYGASDIGGGLAAQLVTELTKTGRFIVIERADLSGVLREQELGLTRIAAQETAAQVGKVFGAQLLVHGSVTEFEQTAGGGGLRVGVGLPGAALGLGGNSVTGRVAIDLRLIDTTTGEIIQSHRAEGRVSQRGVSADLAVRSLTIGGDTFERNPLGQATREAIAQAVGFIVAQLEAVPWTGRVVDATDGTVYVNAGRDANLKPGQRLLVSSLVKELTDPASGAALGIIERPIGEIEVETVQDKFSVARALTPMRTARGDLVRLAR